MFQLSLIFPWKTEKDKYYLKSFCLVAKRNINNFFIVIEDFHRIQ